MLNNDRYFSFLHLLTVAVGFVWFLCFIYLNIIRMIIQSFLFLLFRLLLLDFSPRKVLSKSRNHRDEYKVIFKHSSCPASMNCTINHPTYFWQFQNGSRGFETVINSFKHIIQINQKVIDPIEDLCIVENTVLACVSKSWST